MPDGAAQVQIVMGSKSDAAVVKESGLTEVFDEVGVSFEAHVYSAHRNPGELGEYVSEAMRRGAQVFIGIAGMAAALPGAIAGDSGMMKPVIAVPLDDDGLKSCVAMPPGVPVLTAGMGGDAPGDRNRKRSLKNAAIAACQILAIGDDGIRDGLKRYLNIDHKPPHSKVNLEEIGA